MNARDELAEVIYKARWVDAVENAEMATDAKMAETILAAGWVKPRTIESAYEDYGPDTLPPLTVVLSGGKPAIRKHDGTWMDYDGSSWDDWEMEYPLTVLHEGQA